jgi:outer membrane protein assembly factor BamB
MTRTGLRKSLPLFSLCALCAFVVNSRAAEPWSTYRGNTERTGCTDGNAGPKEPAVVWFHESQDHFIASPLPFGDRLYLSGLGGFNVGSLYAFDVDPKTKKEKRIAWSVRTPYLKLPTVSTPAVMDGKLIFGDGMHQTDGAILHCLRVEKGLPLWQYPVPGTLVHMEGSPTVAHGKVYVGGGAAGVICIDPSRLTLKGKEHTLAEIQKLLDKEWADLEAQYQKDLKDDPMFAMKPNPDQLSKPAPVLAWQQGKEKWHVDAPVAVAGDFVLAASAFLDKEKVGDRALFALDAKTGDVKWRKPLPLNPWGGPAVSGKTVVVSGSSVAFTTVGLDKANGFVAAYNLDDGKELWTKELPAGAGVLSCVALTKDLAIATATDGKVRAFDLTDNGEKKWVYDAKAPFFAPVAVDATTVYAADLKGVVHAINLADGTGKWKLDLGAEPVKSPGMVYGGPVLSGGKLYVATCNLEGPFARKPTVVACIGEK